MFYNSSKQKFALKNHLEVHERSFTEDLRENILASRDCSSADHHVEIINDNNTRITFRMTGLEPKVTFDHDCREP